jgi:hypothetical protein
MNRVLTSLAAVGLVLVLVSCDEPPIVFQGTVLSYDAGTKTMALRDEAPPQKEMALVLTDAAVGAAPEVGDVVRASYRAADGRFVAIRVMNLTRQKELKK